MARTQFYKLLEQEITTLDVAGTSKRRERVIESFTHRPSESPKAIIGGKEYTVFNSNDYLGLRFHPKLAAAEHTAARMFGTGPGAVRFISGSTVEHEKLEQALAKFHNREAAIVLSSAYAANLALISTLVKGQRKDTLVSDKVLVISDELNHRSIIDGVTLSKTQSADKRIYPHFDYDELDNILQENVGAYDRALVITDGVFSMLGEYVNVDRIKAIVDTYNNQYSHGVFLVVDDSHGIGVLGPIGQGVEGEYHNKADVLTATLGKGLGADGGYIVGDQILVDYIRESAASYIYSNSITPGTAAAARVALEMLMEGPEGEGAAILGRLKEHIVHFKAYAKHLPFATDSQHAIQPILIGDSIKTKTAVQKLFERGYLVTAISYPVVPKGRDELRVQLSAAHTTQEIEQFVDVLTHVLKEL